VSGDNGIKNWKLQLVSVLLRKCDLSLDLLQSLLSSNTLTIDTPLSLFPSNSSLRLFCAVVVGIESDGFSDADAFGVHLIDALCVGGADEVTVHVEDFARVRLHQVLVLFAFNLDHAHDHSINHVHALALLVFLSVTLSLAFDCLHTLLVVVVVLLGFLVEGLLILLSPTLEVDVDQVVISASCAGSSKVLLFVGKLLLVLLLIVDLEKIGSFGLLLQVTSIVVAMAVSLVVQEDRVRDRSTPGSLERRQLLLLLHIGSGSRANCRDVSLWLRTVTRSFVLNLQVVEASSVVQGVSVCSATASLVRG